MNPKNLPAGKNPPEQINVFIEIPAGGNTKYEIDADTGALFVDRFLHTASVYPFNYGFIPSTNGEDGDPLDVIVLSSSPVVPGCVMKCQPIGMLEMEDEEGLDAKLLAVPVAKVDPIFGAYKDITDVPEPIKNKIKHFFETYKTLEPGKWVKVNNWQGAGRAKEEIKKGMNAK